MDISDSSDSSKYQIYEWNIMINNLKNPQSIKISAVGETPELAREKFTKMIMRISRYGIPILYTYDDVNSNYTSGNVIKMYLGRSNDSILNTSKINYIYINSQLLDYLLFTLPVKSRGLNYYAKPFTPSKKK